MSISTNRVKTNIRKYECIRIRGIDNGISQKISLMVGSGTTRIAVVEISVREKLHM